MRRIIALLILVTAFSAWFVMGEQSTESSFSGQVIDLKVVPLSKDNEPGIHMTVKGESGEYLVHLGPKWIAANQSLGLGKGDDVMIVGLTMRFNDRKVVVPSSITKK